MSHALIDDFKKKAVPVNQACNALSVSRSGYYSAAKVSLAAPKVCNTSVHLKAAFAASGRTYGSRRLCTALQLRGITIGRHRVRSLMRLHKLRSVWRRKFIRTTDSKHTMAVSNNVLDRQFARALPNQAWVSDITLHPHSKRLAVPGCCAGLAFAQDKWAGPCQTPCLQHWCVRHCRWPSFKETQLLGWSCTQTGARNTPALNIGRC